MEARSLAGRLSGERRSGTPTWLLGLLPLALVAGALVVFAALNAPGLPERTGPPIEELAVERTVLRPGEIVLALRNDGPDPVQVAQVEVNGGFVDFRSEAEATGRLGTRRVEIVYPWVEGEAYRITLLTSTGATVATEIPVAVATPRADGGFYATMALIGFYVGIVPVVLGMLWLPWVRRVGAEWIRVLMAVTVGLLVFLALDATLDGFQIAATGAQSLGGGALVLGGAVIAYLVLSGVDAWVRARRAAGEAAGSGPWRLALLISIGVGLHNLAEGLAIGSAYAIGELALGAFLVVGFVLQNTSEGWPSSRRWPARNRPGGAWCCSAWWPGFRPSPAPGSAPRPSTPAWRRCCSAPVWGPSRRSSGRSCPRYATRPGACCIPPAWLGSSAG